MNGEIQAGMIAAFSVDAARAIDRFDRSDSPHLLLDAISRNLGISVTTVKTHRQNLYAKLGLSTQQELFSLFLMSLQRQDDQSSRSGRAAGIAPAR